MKKKMTIDDVAREVGVSRQTVSRAINGMDGINPATRERVMDTIHEMGYRPSRLARGMAGRHTKTIGLILGRITNPAQAEIFQNLYNTAEQDYYNVLLRHSNYSKKLENEAAASLISENVDGIVIISPQNNLEDIVSLANPNCPIVVVHRDFTAKHVSSITTDTVRATKSAVEYLMGAGHTTIGLITRPGELNAIRHYQGYKQALESRGLSADKNFIVQVDPNLEGGYAAAKQLFNKPEKVTAITAYNDLTALGALKACHEFGLQVPESVAIFGYNDIPYASYCSPTLSTIRIRAEEVGKNAFRRLKEMIEQPEIDFPPVVLDIDLVIRESTIRG